jgi:tripartite-type tricarboxylate transporter receptor subunit TctC
MALAAIVSLVAAACGSSTKSGGSAPTTSSAGSLSAGMAYYKGKTITLIAPDKPGGGFDNWARTLAPAMAQYLGATINITNIPAGNTIVGQNTLASASPDGLTIGWLNLVEDVSEKAAGVSGITFDPSKLAIIGATAPIPVVVIASPSSPYTSMAALASAPGPVKTLTQTKGSTALIERVIMSAFGVKTQYIAGYESSADLKAGFTRGDGQVAVDNVSAFGPLITGKAARPLLVTSQVSGTGGLASALTGVPTVSEFAAQHTPAAGTQQVLNAVMSLYTYNVTLAAPTGTPANEVAALRAAMQWAMQQTSVQQQAAKLHLVAGYESASDTLNGITTGFAAASQMKPYVPGA